MPPSESALPGRCDFPAAVAGMPVVYRAGDDRIERRCALLAGRSGGGLIRADAGFVCQSLFRATDCGQGWLLAPSPVPEQLLRRSKCSTETEQDSAAPPQVALESLVYRFVGPVKKQQR